MKKNGVEIRNRKAGYDYEFLENYVAGVQLLGTEAKAIRQGHGVLVDAYCFFDDGELYAKGIQVQALDNAESHDPLRIKKLLLTKKELTELEYRLTKGLTIVIKKMFHNKRGLLKLEIALAKGKKEWDKRNSIKARDQEREMRRGE